MNAPRRITGERLNARLQQLAGITSGGPGVTRLAYSSHDVDARNVMAGWMAEAGLSVHLDAAANLIGRTARAVAGEPAIMIGSHLDTVVEGGPLDGAYGVVAAVEVARYLGRMDPAPALAVVAFANEEGVIAPPGRTGSLTIAGAAPPASTVVDSTGRTLGELIESAGGRPENLDEAAWDPSSLVAFFELHIEQGPLLHDEGTAIGVVEAVTARVVADIVITGTANHAGTTPMGSRHDALAAGAEVIRSVQQLAVEGSVRVATAGSMAVSPNVRNVIPGRVEIGVDLRDPGDTRLARGVDALAARLDNVAASTGTQIGLTMGPTVASTPMTESLMATIEMACDELGLTSVRLPSGAGHDAQSIAALCPAAMIFVPSIDGISHAPGERSSDQALVDGANVLLEAILICQSAPTTRGGHRGDTSR